MGSFLEWVNAINPLDPVLKSAVGQLWFVTVHSFDDGNGRITRAIADMFLAQADGGTKRFYSMSSQISKDRKRYFKRTGKFSSSSSFTKG